MRRSPIRARRSASAASSTRARAAASISRSGTRMPSCRSRTRSRQPGESVVTIGRPEAAASIRRAARPRDTRTAASRHDGRARPPRRRRPAMPVDARLGRPGAQIFLRERGAVRRIGRAEQMKLDRRAGRARPPHRGNRLRDPLRLEHARHDRDFDRRRRRLRRQRKILRIDPRAGHDRHRRLAGSSPNSAGSSGFSNR